MRVLRTDSGPRPDKGWLEGQCGENDQVSPVLSGLGEKGAYFNMWSLAKRVMRRLLGHRYFSVRAYRHLLISRLRRREPLFVHSMGKVGSSTIVRSLEASGLEEHMPIHWTTFLSPEGVRFLEDLQREGYGGRNKVPIDKQSAMVARRVLSRELGRGHLIGGKCKVVTLVRDPVATNVAGFFQNHAWWPPELRAKCTAGLPGYVDDLAQLFFEKYPHDVPLTWFDTELKGVFGVDVFRSEFPRSKGYKVYRGGPVEVLVCKLEKLDDCAEEAFREFLGIEGFTVQKANVASGKWYASIYQEFKDGLVLPAAYADRMFNSRVTRHFYDDEEIESFRVKWRTTDLGSSCEGETARRCQLSAVEPGRQEATVASND